MDLSDVRQSAPPSRIARRGQRAREAHELVAQIGGEVATVVSSAIERVALLAATGRIDGAGLRALRAELEQARRIGIIGQQLARFASGRVQLSDERVDLRALLRDAVAQRSGEADARGLLLKSQFEPAVISGDPTLVYSLVQSVLDWAIDTAGASLALSVDVKAWPTHARLRCEFDTAPDDEPTSAPMPLVAQPVDTIAWRLVQQTAATLGLIVERDDRAGRVKLAIEFPQTVLEPVEGLAAPDADELPSLPGRPLEGSHVLVVAAGRELRTQVRDALRPMRLMVDYVTSIDEARAFCKAGMPHAIVHDATMGGERFEQLRRELLAESPTLGFIQIAAEGHSFEVLDDGRHAFASVGREAVSDSLPAALLFELART